MSGSAPREKVHHPLFARAYMRLTAGGSGDEEYRGRLLAGLSGRVIEVGAGNGLNFAHYPSTVDKVVAVEPEPTLRQAAIEEAVSAPADVEVVDGLADALPVADASQDAAVASLVLCSVPDQAEALAEIRRVLRPGGELRFYEHVRAHRTIPAALQKVADATLWPRVAGGCHVARDTTAAIEAADFEIDHLERFLYSAGVPLPPIPHILGVAHRT